MRGALFERERERELDQLDRLIGSAAAGDAALALVEGPAGIGKSRLLTEARAIAEAAGFRVVAARGGELERELPFGIVRQLFESMLRDPDSQARWLQGPAGSPYPVGRFYTSAFTTPVSNMLDYYQGLAVQAFNMLAEVNHLSWTLGGITFAANNAVVETYAERVPAILANWSRLATGGVGRLPDHVVADTQTGLMWSQSNLTLAGSKVFCWSLCGSNLSLSTLLTPGTVIDGVSGWAVPSQAQLAALVSGQKAFSFLTANGFQWQRSGPVVQVSGIPITVPAYWSTGGTSVDFAFGNGDTISLHNQNYWPVFLPGPGAVAVRPLA